MADDDDNPTGAPAWMATFADLMSLLMCFFVLLLSFSEMDVEKYKQIAGSMRMAFGVQNKVNVQDIPKGTSIIAKEFSPGKPDPTDVKTVQQVTTDPTKMSLSVGNPDASDIDPAELDKEQTKELLKKKLAALVDETEKDADKLREMLGTEISEGKIDIDAKGRSITIRIRERGSFPSGSATLNIDFEPVMARLRDALTDIDGKIAVEGHTDNVPIRTARFRSNWDLSATRALSVTHELIKDESLDNDRFMVVGLADTKPHQPNDSAQNRAQNRRVEIVIRQGLDEETAASLKNIQGDNQSILEELELDDDTGDIDVVQ